MIKSLLVISPGSPRWLRIGTYPAVVEGDLFIVLVEKRVQLDYIRILLAVELLGPRERIKRKARHTFRPN